LWKWELHWCLELPSTLLSFVWEAIVIVVVATIATISIVAIVVIISIFVIILAIFLASVCVLFVAGQELWCCVVLAEFTEDCDCMDNIHHWSLKHLSITNFIVSKCFCEKGFGLACDCPEEMSKPVRLFESDGI